MIVVVLSKARLTFWAINPTVIYFQCRGGSRTCERVEREPITGSGAEPPAASRDRWGKLFVYFHTEKAKILVFKLKKTPMFGPFVDLPVFQYPFSILWCIFTGRQHSSAMQALY